MTFLPEKVEGRTFYNFLHVMQFSQVLTSSDKMRLLKEYVYHFPLICSDVAVIHQKYL